MERSFIQRHVWKQLKYYMEIVYLLKNPILSYLDISYTQF